MTRLITSHNEGIHIDPSGTGSLLLGHNEFPKTRTGAYDVLKLQDNVGTMDFELPDNIFLNEQTVAGVSEVVFTGIGAAYTCIRYANVIFSSTSNQAIRLQFSSDGGTTWHNTNYEWQGVDANGTTFSGFTSSSSSVQVGVFGGTDSNNSCFATIQIYNSGASVYTSLYSNNGGWLNSTTPRASLIGAQLVSATAVNAIRLFSSIGDDVSGTFTMWGY